MSDRFRFRACHKESEQYYYFNLFDLKKHSLDDFEEEDIEQCTGLKDKNGKLIYENDLIKCPNGIYRIAVDDFGLWTAIYENNPLKGVVEWSDIVKNYAFNQENVEIEVIGNGHEKRKELF